MDRYLQLVAELQDLLAKCSTTLSGKIDPTPEYLTWTEKNSPELMNFVATNSRRLSKTGSINPMYLITFTHNQTTDKALFRAAVIKQLNRSIFLKVRFAEEHKDTNYHIHAICTSKFNLNKTNFESHSRKHGHVDVRHVTEDNGLDEYISKENEIIILRQ